MDIPEHLLITADRLDSYLEQFKDKEKTDLANASFWNGKRVLITGVSGFAGSHISEKLLEYGAEVHGFIRRHSVPDYPNISGIRDKIQLVEGNLEDFGSVTSALDAVEPHVIFHLGAQSFVPTSFRVPLETYSANIQGTANLLEAVRRAKSQVDAIHVACTSEEYGKVSLEHIPINEDAPLQPMSPYAISKTATDILMQGYHRVHGLPTVITRGFNHSGLRRGLQFVTSVVARQIAKCSLGQSKTVTIGNPHAIRDFTHVDDMMQGYLLAVEKGRKGVPYNLGHGLGITVGELVKVAAKISGVSDVETQIDKSRFRPAEVDVLICDYSRAKADLGYSPRHPITTAISDAVNFFKTNTHLLNIERH